ncbi:MAG: MerR family transcriptional regulator [Woeseia sp.]
MRIGALAASCGCPAETVRYYEKIGLLPQPPRLSNGYRSYDEHHQKWLQFILRSRALGFTQGEVRRLSDIANQADSACMEVHDLLAEHIVDVQEKLRDLGRLEKALLRLKSKCREGTLNDCPVIDELMS